MLEHFHYRNAQSEYFRHPYCLLVHIERQESQRDLEHAATTIVFPKSICKKKASPTLGKLTDAPVSCGVGFSTLFWGKWKIVMKAKIVRNDRQGEIDHNELKISSYLQFYCSLLILEETYIVKDNSKQNTDNFRFLFWSSHAESGFSFVALWLRCSEFEVKAKRLSQTRCKTRTKTPLLQRFLHLHPYLIYTGFDELKKK